MLSPLQGRSSFQPRVYFGNSGPSAEAPKKLPKRVVIVGNGIGGTNAAKTFETLIKKFKLAEKLQVTLLGRSPNFVFKPFLPDMLHGKKAEIPMAEILKPDSPVKFQQAEVKKWNLDADNKTVETDKGIIPYDELIIAVGSETAYKDTPGAREYSFHVETPEDMEKIKNSIVEKLAKAAQADINSEEMTQNLSFVIVGGGPTGVETALEMHAFMEKHVAEKYADNPYIKPVITILEKYDDVLHGFHPSEKKYTKELLAQKGIIFRPLNGVKSINDQDDFDLEVGADKKNLRHVKLKTQQPIWVSGVTATPLVKATELPKEKKDRLAVDGYLTVPGKPFVRVIGDASAAKDAKGEVLPTLGQVAEQQGKFVAVDMVRQETSPNSRKPFGYFNKGTFLSLGPGNAVMRPTFSPLPLGGVGGGKVAGRVAHWLRNLVYGQKMDSLKKD